MRSLLAAGRLLPRASSSQAAAAKAARENDELLGPGPMGEWPSMESTSGSRITGPIRHPNSRRFTVRHHTLALFGRLKHDHHAPQNAR